MTKKIFPFVFGRKGGAKLSLLSSFQEDEIDHLSKNLYLRRVEIDTAKKSLVELLYQEIKKCTGHSERNGLIKIKRDLYNDREVSLKSNELYPMNFKEDLKTFLKNREDFKNEVLIFNDLFYKTFYKSIKNLKCYTNRHFFKNGLNFSSWVISQEIEKCDFEFPR